MKALSLIQPWATLVLTGAKGFETRSWTTTYRGPLLIHAAKGFPVFARDFCISVTDLTPTELPFGAIIGRVVLKNIYRTEDLAPTLTALELLYGDYLTGRWAWELVEAEAFEHPIPYKGALGLFEVILLAELPGPHEPGCECPRAKCTLARLTPLIDDEIYEALKDVGLWFQQRRG